MEEDCSPTTLYYETPSNFSDPMQGATVNLKAMLPIAEPNLDTQRSRLPAPMIYLDTTRTSQEEGDIAKTLNNFQEYCINSMNSKGSHGGSKVLISDFVEGSASQRQMLLSKARLGRSNKASQYIAVPIKNAGFELDNRTTKNSAERRWVEPTNYQYFSPKRKAILQSQREMDACNEKFNQLMQEQSQTSEDVATSSFTNHMQQPHYLKSKQKAFQRLITKNTIKRSQLEQLMHKDKTLNAIGLPEDNLRYVSSSNGRVQVLSKCEPKKALVTNTSRKPSNMTITARSQFLNPQIESPVKEIETPQHVMQALLTKLASKIESTPTKHQGRGEQVSYFQKQQQQVQQIQHIKTNSVGSAAYLQKKKGFKLEKTIRHESIGRKRNSTTKASSNDLNHVLHFDSSGANLSYSRRNIPRVFGNNQRDGFYSSQHKDLNQTSSTNFSFRPKSPLVGPDSIAALLSQKPMLQFEGMSRGPHPATLLNSTTKTMESTKTIDFPARHVNRQRRSIENEDVSIASSKIIATVKNEAAKSLLINLDPRSRPKNQPLLMNFLSM